MIRSMPDGLRREIAEQADLVFRRRLQRQTQVAAHLRDLRDRGVVDIRCVDVSSRGQIVKDPRTCLHDTKIAIRPEEPELIPQNAPSERRTYIPEMAEVL